LTLVAVLVTLVAARLAKSSGGKNWVLDNSEFFRQKEIATKSDVEVEQDLDKRNTHCDQGTYKHKVYDPVQGEMGFKCAVCPIGKYQNEYSVRPLPCKICVIGKYQPKPGENSCDYANTCPKGTYRYKYQCYDCPTGRISAVAGTQFCQKCPRGRTTYIKQPFKCELPETPPPSPAPTPGPTGTIRERRVH
jgi:hypothetical protein